jgi:hypothetical protein
MITSMPIMASLRYKCDDWYILLAPAYFGKLDGLRYAAQVALHQQTRSFIAYGT